ncbi:TrmB family transcriptional regulator sugar-binding domain-containing protein [Streptomyces sp. NPDC005930]|uniref:TrmB family transcriptional regulator sugar-binding domain-containing protein n=1 Tax=Streptomyces sp. NPDC005930 TaxID=3364736 RepID=UPI0036C22F0B
MPHKEDDELERSLLEVRALIETTVALHRSRSRQERLITILPQEYDVVLDTAQELITGARRSIDLVHARQRGPEEQAERTERELIYGAREGVAVRLLSSPELIDEDYVREQLGRQRPVAIRITRIPPLQALIVDRETALVVAHSAVGRRASLIRAPEVMHTLGTLFENVWAQAVPAGERLVFGDRDRAAMARRILGALHASVTDEVAAREQGISVRTYRRHVADIMTLLGATSRFQAGVRAAELGLLPPATRSGPPRGQS